MSSPQGRPILTTERSATGTADPRRTKFVVCNNCRRLKRKCDRITPSCSRCRLAGIPCQYGPERKRPGPAKGAVKSQTHALMSRISELEAQVEALSQRPTTAGSTPAVLVDIDECMMWSPGHTSRDLDPQTDLIVASPSRTGADGENEWPLQLSGPTAIMGGSNATQELLAGTLSPAAEQLLTSLYFDHIQPIFPLFRKPIFYQQLITHDVPDMLLAAMFAVSSRFLPPQRSRELFGDFANLGEGFSKIAHRKLRERMRANLPVTLFDVKVACLLAVYEYTEAPSRQGWVLVGNAVRLALMAQLHQVDCVDAHASISLGEMEERRFVWWTIWRLDCTVNVTACTPFGIDSQMIGTNLVSTTVEDFTAGNIDVGFAVFPEMDPVRFWNSPIGPQLCDAGDGFNTHLFATSILRAVSECQQRLHIKPSPEDIKRIATLDDILSCVHIILPQSFFCSHRREMESLHSHRLRLETIVMFNTAQLIVHEPINPLMMTMALPPDSRTVSLKSWQDSITFAGAIAEVLHRWPSSYFAISDPIISCAIWHAYCGLTIYSMSGLDPSMPSSRIQASLDMLQTSLEKFTAYWPIARMLQDSLQILQAWSWATVDIRKLVNLISHTRKAFSPYSDEPGSVDVALLCDAVL